MGKRNRHRHAQQQTPSTSDLLAAATGGADEVTNDAAPAEEQPTTPEPTGEETEPTTPSEAPAEQTAEAPAPAPEEQPEEETQPPPEPVLGPEIADAPPPPEPPKPQENNNAPQSRQAEPTTPKTVVVAEQPVASTQTERKPLIMSSDLLPKGNPLVRRREAAGVAQHTAEGRRLIAKFDEYEQMCAIKTDDPKECARRIKFLSELTNLACSAMNEKSDSITTDLIKIAFDRFLTGWGTIYNEANLFKRDYALNNPAQIDKVNAFWVAIIQLIEAAKYQRRISFDPKALANVLKNDSVVRVIVRMRDTLVEKFGIDASDKQF